MQEGEQHETSRQLSGKRRRRKRLYFTTRRVRERASSMRKKHHSVVHKYIEDLAETQRSIELCDMEQDKVQEGEDADLLDDIVEQHAHQEEDEEDEQIDHTQTFEDDQNNSDAEQKTHDAGEQIHTVSSHLEPIMFIENHSHTE